jgi:methylglyoxal synthase
LLSPQKTIALIAHDHKKDKYYGDVFKTWDYDENSFYIFFGTAGDEFKK